MPGNTSDPLLRRALQLTALGLLLGCAIDQRSPGVALDMDSGAPGSNQEASGTAENDALRPSGGTSSSGGRRTTSTPTIEALTVHLRLIGDGLGSIHWRGGSGSGSGGEAEQDCAKSCTVQVAPGTDLRLSAALGLNSVVRGWTIPSCGSATACNIRVDEEMNVGLTLEFGFNVAFATDQSYTPTELPRPGLAANQECARAAAAADLHGTRFVAWLAAEGPTTDPADDVTPVKFFEHGGGWVRPDGQPVARSLTSLLRGELLHPLLLDERGRLTARYIWSGTTATGLLDRSGADSSANDCNNWNSNDLSVSGGITSRNSLDLGGGARSGCSGTSALLCFGDDSAAEVPLPAAQGRLAFLSAGSFTPSGGIVGADALCQREACQAGLTGSSNCATNPGNARTFQAYLHATNQPAWERFDLSGPTWVRVDGVPWLAAAADLGADASARLTGLNVQLDGSYQLALRVWTGSTVDDTSNCRNWTSASAPDTANFITPDFVENTLAFGSGVVSCTESNRLFCLEN